MFKRLQIFLGFVVSWIVGALVFPWVFLVIAAAILIWAGVHMGIHKKVHSAGIFFSTVGLITALFATVGFVAQSGGEVDDDDVIAVDSDAREAEADAEANAEGRTAVAEKEEEEAAGTHVDGGGVGGDGERLTLAAQGVKDALALSKNKGKCNSPDSIGEVWRLLSMNRSVDPGFKKAQKALPKLEGCRKKAAIAHTAKAKKTAIKDRVAFAKALGKELKEHGITAQAKPQGKDKVVLTVKCNKATSKQLNDVTASGAIEEGTLLGRLQAVGFTKVTFAAKGKPLVFELSPASDTARAEQELEELGLSSPFALE